MILPALDRETSGSRKECARTHWIDSDRTSGYREGIKQHSGGERDSMYFNETLQFHCFSRWLDDPEQSQQVAETRPQAASFSPAELSREQVFSS